MNLTNLHNEYWIDMRLVEGIRRNIDKKTYRLVLRGGQQVPCDLTKTELKELCKKFGIRGFR